jgi:hypothetical protein
MPSPPRELVKGDEESRLFQYRQLKTPMQASLFLSSDFGSIKEASERNLE